MSPRSLCLLSVRNIMPQIFPYVSRCYHIQHVDFLFGLETISKSSHRYLHSNFDCLHSRGDVPSGGASPCVTHVGCHHMHSSLSITFHLGITFIMCRKIFYWLCIMNCIFNCQYESGVAMVARKIYGIKGKLIKMFAWDLCIKKITLGPYLFIKDAKSFYK